MRFLQKYSTQGYAVVNLCTAYHLLPVKANGRCGHSSTEETLITDTLFIPIVNQKAERSTVPQKLLVSEKQGSILTGCQNE